MAYDRFNPYNELPQLPPAQEFNEDPVILKKLVSASRALAKVDGQIEKLPNPKMLINTIGLQEAKTSTEIENIFTTDDELYRAISSDKKLPKIDSSTKEVLRYKEALWTGYNNLAVTGKFDVPMIIDIMQKIKKTNEGIRPSQALTVIKRGQSELRPGEVVYTPPRGKGVLEPMLKNLVEYLNSDDKTDPLVKMAIAHYQFESIHPFSDGNGRTGRIINLLYLVNSGLLSSPALYLSKQIIASKDAYYYQLGAVRQNNDFTRWVLYMLDVVEKTSLHIAGIVQEILDQMDATLEYGKSNMKWYNKEINEVLFTQPYTKWESLATAMNKKARNTMKKYISELVRHKILRPQKEWKETYYVNNELVKILEG